MGSISIYWNEKYDLVSQFDKFFDKSERMMITLFPEGTRKKVGK
jgi:hypothetical protein